MDGGITIGAYFSDDVRMQDRMRPMGREESLAVARGRLSDGVSRMAGGVSFPSGCVLSLDDLAPTINDVAHGWTALAFGLQGCRVMRTEDGVVRSVEFEWSHSCAADGLERASECVQAAQTMAHDATSAHGYDVLGLCEYVHDAIAESCEYADGNHGLQDAYDALCGGRAVCGGISRAFECVMGVLGVRTASVMSEAMNHQWSMVDADGIWYHVDVTYDLPNGMHSFGSTGIRRNDVSHDCLLRSDDAMTLTGHHDWHLNVMCEQGVNLTPPAAPYDCPRQMIR